MTRPVHILILAIAGVALLAAIYVLPMMGVLPPSDSAMFWNVAYNAGHVPIFGLFTLVLLGISRAIMPWSGRRYALHYVLAFLLSMVFGVVTEAVQVAGPRDADVGDMINNFVGATAFLLFAATLDPAFAPRFERFRIPLRGMLRIAGVVLALLPFVPVTALGSAYLARNAAFPVLCSFQTYWESFFIAANGVDLKLAYLPEQWQEDPENLVALATFTGREWPSLTVREPYPDWTGYDELTLVLYSALDEPVQIAIRIDDIHHNQMFEDRFTRRFDIRPGRNVVVVPLEDVRAAPEGRETDMAHIRKIMIFARSAPETFSLYLDDLRLR